LDDSEMDFGVSANHVHADKPLPSVVIGGIFEGFAVPPLPSLEYLSSQECSLYLSLKPESTCKRWTCCGERPKDEAISDSLLGFKLPGA